MLRFFSLLFALLMSHAPSLLACEGCKEPANVVGDSGVAGISASFSWSVVFMLGMLAFLLTGLVFMMVRSCKQLAKQQNLAGIADPDGFNLPSSPATVGRYGSAIPALQS